MVCFSIDVGGAGGRACNGGDGMACISGGGRGCNFGGGRACKGRGGGAFSGGGRACRGGVIAIAEMVMIGRAELVPRRAEVHSR